MQGYSYNEINAILGVPKSTLSGWLKTITLTKKAKDRLQTKVSKNASNAFLKRNKEQTIHAQNRARDTRQEYMHKINSISNNDLVIIGAVLYWAEGYKRLKVRNGKEITAHVIGLTNSDPCIVHSFILFLRKILDIPMSKIFIEMRLFKHINAEEAIAYWMKNTGLPSSQFKKPMYPVSKASKGIRPKNRLPYGTVRVIVSDTKLFYRVMGFIDGIKKRIIELSMDCK